MCMSPHEMTSARIEQILASYRERLAKGENEWGEPLDRWTIQTWTGKVENFEKLLKERADNGTYATAGRIGR